FRPEVFLQSCCQLTALDQYVANILVEDSDGQPRVSVLGVGLRDGQSELQRFSQARQSAGRVTGIQQCVTHLAPAEGEIELRFRIGRIRLGSSLIYRQGPSRDLQRAGEIAALFQVRAQVLVAESRAALVLRFGGRKLFVDVCGHAEVADLVRGRV